MKLKIKTVSGAPTTSGGTSSSGGGTAPKWTSTRVVTSNELSSGFTAELKNKYRLKLKISDQTHYVGAKNVLADRITLEITSEPQSFTLGLGKEKKFDVNDDNYYDLLVRLESVEANTANLFIRQISEKIIEGEFETRESEEEPLPSPDESKDYTWILTIIIIIIAAAVLIYIVYRNKNKLKFF